MHFYGVVSSFSIIAATALATLPRSLETLHDGDVVPGSYIVTLKPAMAQKDVENHLEWVTEIHQRSLNRRNEVGHQTTYTIGDFRAYSGEFDEGTVAKIKANQTVALVEPNRIGSITAVVEQTNAPWGIAALSHRDRLNDSRPLGQTYLYDSSAGEDTYAYVLDAGILVNHTDFEGRASRGFNAWEGREAFEDYIGHGTHVAGTIASRTYGVAKKASIIDVKVGAGFGLVTLQTFLDGFSWAVSNITKTPGRIDKSVVNMSFGIDATETANNAVDAAYALGVVSVVAAGNSGKNASQYSPASAPSAITVGAVFWNNSRPDWSNYGPGVDIFAPGYDIVSTWNSGDVQSDSGTSMASPHVAGLVLYLRSLEGLTSANSVVSRIRDLASKGLVQNAGQESPNLLAYNGIT